MGQSHLTTSMPALTLTNAKPKINMMTVLLTTTTLLSQ